MTNKMTKLFEAARRSGVPFLAIRTVDPAATIAALQTPIAEMSTKETPLVQWDAARGISPINNSGKKAIQEAKIVPGDTIGFTEAMVAAALLPDKTILFVWNAVRQLHSQEPQSAANAVQSFANLRDQFKTNFRMVVALGPVWMPPPELSQDVIVLDHALPTADDLEVIVRELHAEAKLKVPADLSKAREALTGLSHFAAEQVTAMSLTEAGLDVDALWERKRVTIEQTPGLSVYRGTETLDDLRGLTSVKARLRQHINAKTPIGVVVFIDEGSDVFSNVENDSSGVKTDQQRALLVDMEMHNWRGMICVGVPGSGKSALARAFGNEAGVPTIAVDFGGMESKYVGESETNLRRALEVIKAVGNGNAFFILTCNSLKGIRPQFQRRFKRGVFFFDLPTQDEREAIWQLYLKKYDLAIQAERPDDDGWTGAEIRECCESAWDTGVSLIEASKFIIPVSQSRGLEIAQMREEAHGRFLDASRPGAFQYDERPMAKAKRAIQLPAVLAPGSAAMN